MKFKIRNWQKILNAYEIFCKPLCKQLNIPQTAFDILMFLANNPQYTTARDIVEIRGIKANLVSVNIEKLVQQGYIMRMPIEGDRRKTKLVCTESAQPIIALGQQKQDAFCHTLLRDIDESKIVIFNEVLKSIDRNLDLF